MLSTIIKWSIARRWLVIIATALITVWIVRVASQMPVDVFPNFAPPQVEIQTEAPGLAPEEVESLVTLPIESAINGTPGVTTVRSSSAVSISVVKVIFNWGTDIYQARQLVTERLQLATNKLPQGVEPPQISPISSPIGTVIKYAFTVDGETPNSLMEVRRIVDWQVTNRLLAVPGVSQVVVFGGDVRQYQVLIDPAKLRAFDISWQQVTEAAQSANINAPGGYLTNSDTELLVRGVGRISSIKDLKQSVITARDGIPIKLEDVADVQIGAATKRGDASLNGQEAIVFRYYFPNSDYCSKFGEVEQKQTFMKVLLVEDEPDLGTAIKRTLNQEKYIVDWVLDGNEAWYCLESQWTEYTLAIFDWLLPGLSGLELCKKLRSHKQTLPVLMLTAKDRMEDKVAGLDAGADDYLVKPFGMVELLARLRALQRRSPSFQPQQLQIGNLTLDYATYTVYIQNLTGDRQFITLTSKEFQLLEYFMKHPDRIVTRDQIQNQLWEMSNEPLSNVVAAQMRLLRRKLSQIGSDRLIETIHGIGYRLNHESK